MQAGAGGPWNRDRESLPVVPGWAVLRCLGRGRSGDVYLVRSEADCGWAALRVVRDRPHGLTALGEAHLVDVHGQIEVQDGWAVVLDLVEGGTLHRHLQARGRLRAGELVTVLSPLATTVATLHARGTRHGLLDARHVLLSRIGRPVLSDLAGAHAHPEFRDTGSDAAVDVLGLGHIGWLALTGEPAPDAWGRAPLARLLHADGESDRELATVIQACIDPDPKSRPDAGAVAAWLRGCVPPEPLLTSVTDDPHERVTRRIPERFLTSRRRVSVEGSVKGRVTRSPAP